MDAGIKEHTVRAHTHAVGHIRNRVYDPECATGKIWNIIQELESVGATPEDIGSSHEELEKLLQENNISWDEWTASRR